MTWEYHKATKVMLHGIVDSTSKKIVAWLKGGTEAEARLMAAAPALEAEVEKLKALIREAANGKGFCAWCGRERGYGYALVDSGIEHTHDCPACLPDGVIR